MRVPPLSTAIGIRWGLGRGGGRRERTGQTCGGTGSHRREAESWTRSCGTSAIPKLCTMDAEGTPDLVRVGYRYGQDVYFGRRAIRKCWLSTSIGTAKVWIRLQHSSQYSCFFLFHRAILERYYVRCRVSFCNFAARPSFDWRIAVLHVRGEEPLEERDNSRQAALLQEFDVPVTAAGRSSWTEPCMIMISSLS